MGTLVATTTRQFKNDIEHFRVRCLHNDTTFFRTAAVQDYMTRDVIARMLSYLHVDTYYAEAILKRYRLVFVILIWLEEGAQITRFTSSSVYCDARLPFTNADRQDWPNDCLDLFDRFYEQQWEFCVKVWDEALLTKAIFKDDELLPISTQTSIVKGSNSHTFQIELCQDFSGFDVQANSFLLKKCDNTQKRIHAREVESYRILMQQDGIRENIATMYGDYEHKRYLYIVLEFIQGETLEKLYHGTPPDEAEWIIFWKDFAAIFGPLSRIHGLTHDDKKLRATHQDFNPENIMYSLRDGSVGRVFKLIDFALTKFTPDDGRDSEWDFERGGAQSYSAPEICRSTKVLHNNTLRVSWRLDTWSFGAVLSETLVWCALHIEGLRGYRDMRSELALNQKEIKDNGYVGCFHNGERILDAVRLFHGRAVKECKDDRSRVLIKGMAGLAEKMMSEEGSRPQDRTVLTSLERIIKSAETLSDPATNQSQPPRRRPPPRSANTIAHAFASNGGLIHGKSRQHDEDLNPSLEAHSPGTPRAPSLSPNRIPSAMSSPWSSGIVNGSRSRVHNAALSASAESNLQPLSVQDDSVGIADVLEWMERKKAEKHNHRNHFSEATRALPGQNKLTKLMGRDQEFLVDISSSMGSYKSVSDGVLQTFKALTYLVKHCAPGKMRLYPSEGSHFEENSHTTPLYKALNKLEFFQKECELPIRIGPIIENWWGRNRTWIEKGFSKNKTFLGRDSTKKHRGLDLYILTRAAWRGPSGAPTSREIEIVINEYFKKLKDKGFRANTISIHFIIFGAGAEEVENLDTLIQRLSTDIVDSSMISITPQNGNVWEMLLGTREA